MRTSIKIIETFLYYIILIWGAFFSSFFFLASGLICTFVSVMRPGSPQRVKRAVYCVLLNSSGNVSLGQLRMLQQNSSLTVCPLGARL